MGHEDRAKMGQGRGLTEFGDLIEAALCFIELLQGFVVVGRLARLGDGVAGGVELLARLGKSLLLASVVLTGQALRVVDPRMELGAVELQTQSLHLAFQLGCVEGIVLGVVNVKVSR